MSNLSQTETTSGSLIGHYSSRTLAIHVVANWWHPALSSASVLARMCTSPLYIQHHCPGWQKAWHPGMGFCTEEYPAKVWTTSRCRRGSSGPDTTQQGHGSAIFFCRVGVRGQLPMGPLKPRVEVQASLMLPGLGCVYSQKGLLMLGHLFPILLLFLEHFLCLLVVLGCMGGSKETGALLQWHSSTP